MKFTVNSQSLYQKLMIASMVINKKSVSPIQDCFKLGVKGNILHIASSDTEIRLTTKVEIVNSGQDGLICVNAKQLLDALKELPAQPLEFEINDNNKEVKIHYNNGKYTFIGQDADIYPEGKKLDDKNKDELMIDASMLSDVIKGTLFASADDELRPVMNGIYVDITPKEVVFVASDGHKLIKQKCKELRGNKQASFILPKKPASVLLKLLSKEKDVIKINFDLNNAVISIGDFSMTARFIEGRYPNYNSVIPENNENKVFLDRQHLLGVIKRVSVFADPKNSLVKFEMTNNSITVSSQDIDFSTSSEESMECEYNGAEMSIGFKAEFLIEILDSISSSEIELKLSDQSRAGLIIPTSNNYGLELTTLLMPIILHD